MRTKRNLILVFLALILPTFLWLLTFPNTTIKHNANPFLVYSSQLSAVIGFSLFAISFVLTTRIKAVEQYFGGLDKQYHKHHTIGKIAFLMVLIHPVMLSLRWFPNNIEKTFWYFLPVHSKIEINAGSWSLIGLSVLLLFTIVIKLPYDQWKISHKFMRLFLLLAIVHVFGVNSFYEENRPLAIYFIIISVLAFSAFMYKALFYKWLAKKYPFKVININKLSNEVMEITLITKSADFSYIPGQYGFFQFISKGISKESHPFTICGTSKKGEITILVKSLGDFTLNLHDKLTLNTPALVEGPYGCFDYRTGKLKQIWIAGGVGIAPFISWCKDLENNYSLGLEVDLYYCVKKENEAIYLHKFEKQAKTTTNFRVHLSCSDQTGFLKVSDIKDVKDKTIFICGPKDMRIALLKQFKTIKTPKENIIFEDFDFI
jgi:predicted ferric reductase